MLPIDLTGAWHGMYSLPNAVTAPIPFEASLIASESFVGGTITERATEGGRKGSILYATVSGSRAGQHVTFTKTYEPGSEPYTSVSYDGLLSGDGLEISGDWSIGSWRGRFLMIRAGGLATAKERRIEATLPSA